MHPRTPIELTVADAKKLVEAYHETDKVLDLSEVKNLGLPEATALSELWAAQLDLDGLTNVDPDVFKVLLKTGDGVSLNGLTALGPDLAGAFTGSIYPSFVYCLHLNGVQFMPDVIAEEVAALAQRLQGASDSYEGKPETPVELNGLTCLDSPALAKEISRREPAISVSWNALKHISPRAARVLAKAGKTTLPGITRLSPATAKQLVATSGALLLDGRVCDNDEVAEILSEYSGPSLSLCNLESLSPLQAACLAKAKPFELVLGGLNSLHPAAATELAKTSACSLVLKDLTHFEDDADYQLAMYRGSLQLDGFVEAVAMRAELTPVEARLLRKHHGPLDLSGLQTLSPVVAEELASHSGPHILLDGLREWPSDVAGAFMNYPGKISCNRVSDLSDQAAVAVSEYKAWAVSLRGLRALSPLQHQLFSGNDRIKLPNAIKDVLKP